MLTTLSHPPHVADSRAPSHQVVERAEAVMRDVRELQGTPIFCRFDNGTLSLHGRVHSFHAKQLAQTAAADVPGISRVQNQLEVVPRA